MMKEETGHSIEVGREHHMQLEVDAKASSVKHVAKPTLMKLSLSILDHLHGQCADRLAGMRNR